MKRNTIFGGFSLLVAGAAIGAGAVASGSAVAGDDTPPAGENRVEVINVSVGEDGTTDAYKCTLENVDFLGSLPTPTPSMGNGELVVSRDVIGTSGAIPGGQTDVVMASGSGEVISMESLPEGFELPEGVTLGEATTGEIVEVAAGELPIGFGGEVTAINAEDVRDGTDEECASVQFEAALPAPQD